MMSAIALPAFHFTTTRKLAIEIGHELSQDIERYRAFYKQAYSADVSEADLVREMARRFMEADRDFQEFRLGVRSRSRTSRRAAPAQSEEAAAR
jgi:hypothetical protein